MKVFNKANIDIFYVLLFFTVFTSCANLVVKSDFFFTNYVNPFIGTGGHGHTYPGATVPFGMFQVSPDNGITGWDWCSGYHFTSANFRGWNFKICNGI